MYTILVMVVIILKAFHRHKHYLVRTFGPPNQEFLSCIMVYTILFMAVSRQYH